MYNTAKLVVAIKASIHNASTLISLVGSAANTNDTCLVLFFDSLQDQIILAQLLSKANIHITICMAYTGAAVSAGKVYLCPCNSTLLIDNGLLQVIAWSQQAPITASPILIRHNLGKSEIDCHKSEDNKNSLVKSQGNYANKINIESSFKLLAVFLDSQRDIDKDLIQLFIDQGTSVFCLNSDRYYQSKTNQEFCRKSNQQVSTQYLPGVTYFNDDTLLIRAVNHFFIKNILPEAEKSGLTIRLVSEIEVRKLHNLLREKFRFDFSVYKQSTFQRAVERRMLHIRMDKVRDYLMELHGSESEQLAFYRNIIIGVTQFFRDPSVFQYLEKSVFPNLLSKLAKQEILRVWIAGTANGSEAYSYAILLSETIERLNINIKFKIFATDIDKKAISSASLGRFSVKESVGLPLELREKYFNRANVHFKVKPELRSTIVFAKHNLVTDPPLSQMDFVSCRNTLIYFEAQRQKQALKNLDFALKEKGLFVIGAKESFDYVDGHYIAENRNFNVYRKLDSI